MNAPRASGSACGVRSPVRYGRNVRPSAPGSQRRRLVDQLAEVDAAADDAAQPAQRAGGGQHHAHRCQAPGTAWQNAWTRACGSAAVRGQRGEDDARGPERHRQRPGPVDADAEPAGRLVARARRRPAMPPPSCDRRPRATRARVGSHARSSSSASSTSSLQRRARDVEQQRARRVGDVDRALAGQPQPHVVLGQHHVRDARVGVGLVRAQPQQLRRGEAGQRAVAGQLRRAARSRRAPRSRRTRRRCAGRSRGSPGGSTRVGGVERDEPVHLPARGRSRRRRPRAPPAPRSVARHQSSGSCSDQPGFGVDSGYATSRRSSTSPSSATAMTFTAEVPTSMPIAVVTDFEESWPYSLTAIED